MHHQRKKSGSGLPRNNSSTDIRKSVTATDPSSRSKRPTMTRRHTPVNAQKLGRSQRDRERDWHQTWENERESFPQYCMTCEKQFVPRDDKFIYCSESCRRTDQNSAPTNVSLRNYNDSSYSIFSDASSEPRDIIPRASPSRPDSMIFGSSPQETPGSALLSSQHSLAISALRSLNLRPPSPPSPSGSGSSIWPFSKSPNSPSTSFSRLSVGYLSSTFDSGYGGANAASYELRSSHMDRPLPSRNHSITARHRSTELVTPKVGR